jgi:predicted RNA binding protein YcfA (HicA-like mRNA interferase family)
MNRLPVIKPKKLLQLLINKEFFIKRQSGSHIMLGNYNNPSIRVTLPMHNKDLKIKTLLSILKQAGLDRNNL